MAEFLSLEITEALNMGYKTTEIDCINFSKL